jgi:hypothetical protein
LFDERPLAPQDFLPDPVPAVRSRHTAAASNVGGCDYTRAH